MGSRASSPSNELGLFILLARSGVESWTTGEGTEEMVVGSRVMEIGQSVNANKECLRMNTYQWQTT